MIPPGLIAASGHDDRPAAEEPPAEPSDALVGARNAGRAADVDPRLEATSILARQSTTGVTRNIVALLAYFHGAGTSECRMSLRRREQPPADLLAALEEIALRAQAQGIPSDPPTRIAPGWLRRSTSRSWFDASAPGRLTALRAPVCISAEVKFAAYAGITRQLVTRTISAGCATSSRRYMVGHR